MNNVYAKWNRLLAFIIDSVILGIIGVILCAVFYNQFLSMGNWAILVGFFIFVLYYGLQNSVLCKGQTIGKRLLKIKVLSKNGGYLSPAQAMLRSLILTPMLIFNNIVLPMGYVSMMWSAIIVGLTLIQIVLFFANKPTRQLLQDLIVGSVCLDAKAEAPDVVINKTKLTWLIAIPLFAVLATFIIISNSIEKMLGIKMQEFTKQQKILKQTTNTNLIGFTTSYYTDYKTNKVSSGVGYTIYIPNINIRDTKLCVDSMAKVVSVLINNNDKLKDVDVIMVSISQRVNIGIAHVNQNYSKKASLQEWEEYIRNNNIE